MIATAKQLKGADLEKRVNTTPPTQTDGSGGKLPPAFRPTDQGPTDGDLLRDTIELVPGMYPHVSSLQQGCPSKSPSQGKDSHPYDGRN